MTEPFRHSVSVAGVIVDDSGRCLLTRRRDNGNWEAPGGVLEANETIPDGLRREIREETGLEIEPISLTGVYKNMPLGVIALVFRCAVIGGELRLNSEVAEFRWTRPGELDALMTDAYRIRVTDAIHNEGHPAIRSHNGRTLR